MTTRITLYVDQGTDFGVTLNIDESEGSDLITSNTEFFSSARKVFSSAKAFDIDVEPNNEGGFDVSVPAETTLNVNPGKYEYDILMKLENDKTFKIIEGLIFVIPTMTKIETD